ncbi:hypothetical protein COO60DRAFT_1281775 [Scenedesmus sp. NREL 46B-D3]|nr:hypothetical protein COO60DRAFT_1281775 [Scenedesmus sp. NREL 46B-D3]
MAQVIACCFAGTGGRKGMATCHHLAAGFMTVSGRCAGTPVPVQTHSCCSSCVLLASIQQQGQQAWTCRHNLRIGCRWL